MHCLKIEWVMVTQTLKRYNVAESWKLHSACSENIMKRMSTWTKYEGVNKYIMCMSYHITNKVLLKLSVQTYIHIHI